MQKTAANSARKRKFKIYPFHYTITIGGFVGACLAIDMGNGLWTATIFSVLVGGLGAYLHTVAIKPDFIRQKGINGLWSVVLIHSWRLSPFSLAGGLLAWIAFS